MSQPSIAADERALLLETLLAVATSLARPRPLGDNVTDALTAVVESLGLDRGVMRTPLPDGSFELIAEVGQLSGNWLGPMPAKSNSTVARAYNSRTSVVENHHIPNGRSASVNDTAAMLSTAAFPLMYMDDCLGVLHFGSVSEDFFDDARLTFLSSVAQGCGALLYNAQLRDTMERQLRLASDRSEFIEIASHELRTPIAVISGYTELMINSGSFPDKEMGWLAQAQKEATRLGRIVDDLVTLEWMRSGDERGRTDEFSLSYLLGQVWEKTAADWPEAELRIDSIEDVTVIGDLQRLIRVVASVVDNTFRHSGAASAHLATSFDQGHERCKVVVSDNGHGFPEGFTLSDIGMFSRPDYTMTSNVRGLGLGLFVVKTFLESVGGKLSISSSDKGAVVEMQFPVLMTAA